MWLVKYQAGSKNEFIHFLLSALEVSNSYQCLRKLYFWIVLSKRLTKLFFIYSLFALWIWRLEDLWSVFNFILKKTQRQFFCKSGILADCQFLLAGCKTTNRNKMPFSLCVLLSLSNLYLKKDIRQHLKLFPPLPVEYIPVLEISEVTLLQKNLKIFSAFHMIVAKFIEEVKMTLC